MELWARDDLRSLNAQVEFALRMALEKAGRKAANPQAGAFAEDTNQGGDT